MTPQSTPAGGLVTVPIPAPLGMSVTAKLCTAKVAVTVVAAVTVTTQESVPVQASPLQPVKTDPAAGAAVSVTTVPLTKLAVQVTPQSIPAGALVTVPTPVPLGATVSVKFWSANVAVTVVAAVTVTTQGSEPVHPPPLQPVNTEPTAGVAVNVTAVPLRKFAEQLAPQLIPDGVLVTAPTPLPARMIVSGNVDSIVSGSVFDVPPPGAGLTTLT